jgi:branched-chain amino acid transport system substrate-binding protein
MRRIGCYLLAAIALLAASCSGSGGSDPGPIVIGASLPLTGERAQPGSETKRGYQLWADMVNDNGGLLGRRVELKITDNASDEDRVVAAYQHLITQDKVDLLLGTQSSSLNIPASAVAERSRRLYICPSCASPKMFNRGYKYIFFSQPAVAEHQADLFAQYVASIPAEDRPKTAAYPAQDNPFAQPVVESVRRLLEAIGIKTVYSKVYPEEFTDFDGMAAEIRGKRPDLIAQGAVFEDGVGLSRSLMKAGYNPKVLFQTSAPSNGDEYAKAVGRDNTNGVFYAVSWSPDTNYPLNADFVQQYKERFAGAEPSEDAADAFAAAQILQAAVGSVRSLDQARLAQWVHLNKVTTVLGPLSWDDRGAPQQSFILAQWQSGKSRIVMPREVANTDEIVFPKPFWRGQAT